MGLGQSGEHLGCVVRFWPDVAGLVETTLCIGVPVDNPIESIDAELLRTANRVVLEESYRVWYLVFP